MAVMEEGRILAGESVATPVKPRDEDLELAIRRVSSAVLALDGVVFSSVVPEAAPGVAESITIATGVRPAAVTHRSVFPFELAVSEPERVGIDRLCSAAGALPGKRRNAIVVDAGTAVTVDMVRDGRFLGGLILPGPAIALAALSAASQLPLITDRLIDSAPTRFDMTEPSMILGALASVTGGVREAVRHLESQVGTVSRRVITGGLAGRLLPQLSGTWHHDPDLTLVGLDRIARLNGIQPASNS
jgi:type III pantothenate kinase